MNKIATISIIVENNSKENTTLINEILNEYQDIILGRMGLPDRINRVCIISLVVFAEVDRINALTGKLGKINDCLAKAFYSNKTY